MIELFGHRPDSWRIDPTEHPFASGSGRDDVRITTNYHPDSLHSLFSTMHEYGHGLYSHQQPKHLERLPTGGPCSLGIHESQSRLWENLVGRSRPFWRLFYPRLQETYPEQLAGVDLERFHAGIHAVEPGLIRIEADEVTYGMHVMLRFELEQDIVEGRVELRDLPQRWNEKMWDYLGVEVPDDGHGVLQDVHWSGGSIGYFSTYLIGTVASVQIWEAATRDVPDLEEQVGRGEFAPLRDWLGEHIHALGRKYLAAGDAAPRDRLDDRRAAVSRLPPQELRIGLAAPGRRCGKRNHREEDQVTDVLRKQEGRDPRCRHVRDESSSRSHGRRSKTPEPTSRSSRSTTVRSRASTTSNRRTP